jgi:hypothetical protein
MTPLCQELLGGCYYFAVLVTILYKLANSCALLVGTVLYHKHGP